MFAAALIDEHPLLRLGLARILTAISDIGEIRIYDPARPEVHRQYDASTPVEILLFGASGDAARDREWLERMIELNSPRYVLVLAEEPREIAIDHPLIAGKVRKSAPAELLEAAVRLTLAGGKCFPSALPNGQAHPPPPRMSEGWPPPEVIRQGAEALHITPRPFEILLLRARGMSHKAVGRTLGISEATVKAHASATYRRLNVKNHGEALRLAEARGVELMFGSERPAPQTPPEDES